MKKYIRCIINVVDASSWSRPINVAILFDLYNIWNVADTKNSISHQSFSYPNYFNTSGMSEETCIESQFST